MKKTLKRLSAGLLAAVLSLSLLTACTSTKETDKTEDYDMEQSNSEDYDMEQGNSEDANSSDDFASSNEDGMPQTGSKVESVGDFTTQDVEGNAVTQDIFKENDLTMVNVFTTWCTPCVEEMPDLEKLHQKLKDEKVGVVGVVLDVLNEKGEIVDEDLERAQFLVKKTGVTYPVLLPDNTYFNGRLIGIEAFPESFFVDKNGNIVGESYSGSGGLEDWLEVVKNERENMKEGS